MVWRETRPTLDSEVQLKGRRLLNKGVEPERRRELPINAVVHHQKFTVRGRDRQRLHCLKVLQINTLVKVAVVQYDGASWPVDTFAHLQVIVEHKAQVGVVVEVALHLDDTIDRRIDNHAIGIEQDGQLFKDIDEDLVLLRFALFTVLL